MPAREAKFVKPGASGVLAARAPNETHADHWAQGRRQWRSLPARQGGGSIEPGDSGIWATCNMGREAKAVGELKDMFEEVRSQPLPSSRACGSGRG